MFLRRSLASLARAYKLHVYDFFFFMSVHLGACPPPPPYQKGGYATVASFRSPEEWPNEDGRFRPVPPPHSLHEIAATAQGCVLSPILFVLYTNDCRSSSDDISVLKYADDTAIVGHIKGSETDYREYLTWFKDWCKENFLDLNSSKTKEMIIDFRNSKLVDPRNCPMKIDDKNIEIVETYKYLGTTINDCLKWDVHCKDLYKKGQQRLFFLRKLRTFHVDKSIMHLFYKAIIESVLIHDCVVWLTSCRKSDLLLIKRVVRQAEKIIGQRFDFEDLCRNRILEKAKSILVNNHHPLNDNFVMLRSGNRLRSMRCRTSRLLNSFVPASIRMLNEEGIDH